MIIDGRIAAKHYFKLLEARISKLAFKPKLVAIQVGENPASSTYINIKSKTLTEHGIDFEHIQLSADISGDSISDLIQKLNIDESITGMILQLPIPENLNSRALIDLISPKKDVDCLGTYNLGNFFVGNSSLLPATPQGVIRLLEHYEVPISGKNICIIGRSNLVGKPLAVALTEMNATVTLCHSKTDDIQKYSKSADIVITAVGKAKMFTSKYFSKGQTVIDVGTSKDDSGRLSGDVDFDNVKDIVENITPVPGGVGPLTVYCLAENLIKLAEQA